MCAKKYVVVYIIISSLIATSCHRVNTMFTSLSSSETHISFSNNLEKRTAFSILYYLYYYNGGGVSIGDINNDGQPDIYFTANSKGGNKLYLNKGSFEFEDITEKAGVAGSSDWCTGTTMADVNGDGLLDIYVSAVNIKGKLQGHNELFINNGSSPPGEKSGEVSFTESAAKYGLDFSGFTTQTAFFDFDHDGDLDCYILNQSHQPNQNIVDTGNRKRFDPAAGDRLYRNDGLQAASGLPHFTDISAQAGIYQSSLGYGLGISVADINNDGWDDIYIGNDFHENDYYYVNQKNGTFKESGAKHFGHYSRFSMGNDIADYNNDGQADIVTVDMLPPTEKLVKTYGSDENYDTYKFKILRNGFQNQVSRNCLQQNNRNGISFSEIALQSGISATDWSWGPLFADFDNDGKKDLFISSGIVKRPVDLDYIRFVSDLAAKINRNESARYDDETIAKMPDGASHPFLFKGDGKMSFKDISGDWGTGGMSGYYNGAAYADLNNDGNLDLVINCLNAKAVVLKNNAPKKDYLSIAFKGDNLNSFGIGAKAYLFSKDKTNSSQMQYQQLMLTRGFESSSDTRLHFGLDTVAAIDSILIVWPDQKYQVLRNAVANKQIIFLQKDAGGVFNPQLFFPPQKESFEDISDQIKCDWRHKENDFIDFNLQYLIPHEESTRGPKIAVGDVNGDRLDDFYTCGAKFQPGALMLQQPNGSFKSIDSALFSKDAVCEDVDAVFFDANGDGYSDLYVVSGGNEPPVSALAREDRLYLNDGKGHFMKANNFLSQKYENKSCVAVADVDHDGDIDIFVGNLSGISTYGGPSTSYLFLNDGKAHFTLSDQGTLLFTDMGMVTSAGFADVNKDGWQDLIVCGEFMPVKIFINNNGKFVTKDIANSTGLWQTIYINDINGDGYPDILAGNWGHNTKLWAGKNGPVKMYVKDFDRNGTTEQILCYTIDGNEYTFLAKDELERALPVLKKAYLTYGDVAGKTVQYMFYDLFKDYKEFKAETLSSSCFMNDGLGNFTRTDLPPDLQLAPVFSFAPASYNNSTGWLASGNFYGVMPYEGRYDALSPTFFSYNKNVKAFNLQQKLPEVSGEVRDSKWINAAGGQKILVITRNNEPLLFFKPVNK
ncbi:MAG: VCBS repeat-containing protein [Ferruginibacter sp.]